MTIRFVVVHLCDGGDDWHKGRMRGWLLALGCSCDCESARQGITGQNLCQLPRSLPPQDDLGKVCAKFNGRSKGYLAYLVSTKELQIKSQPVDARWPTLKLE